MKKIIALICVVLMVLAIVKCTADLKHPEDVVKSETESDEFKPDYPNSAALEAALDAKKDIVGKTVTITADKLAPDSAFGYNIQTGKHLNFCSETSPGVSEGDKLTVRVDGVSKFLESYIIVYTVIDGESAPVIPANSERSFYYGTWVYYGFESDGIFMTVEKFDEINGTDYSSYYFVIMSYGMTYDYLDDGTVDKVPWKMIENGINIDGLDFTRKDDMIYGDINGVRVYYTKYSDSEEFPNVEKDKERKPAVTTAPSEDTVSDPPTADEDDSITPASGIMYAKDGVNLREGPGTSYDKAGHLDKGEKVEVTGKAENGWYRVKYNGEEYFVSGNYLTDEAPESSEPAEKEAPDTESKKYTDNDIRPEFKELMDQYEEFYDEYIAFVKEYMNAASEGDAMKVLDMLQVYSDWIEKCEEVNDSFSKVADYDMTTAEAVYYAEVALRIEQKLLSIAS